MWDRRRKWLVCSLLLVIAFSFRVCVARFLPNDNPEDGRVYAQLARNLLEQHVYSHLDEPPYPPSISRLPGYPLFLATIYSVFGHSNNTAVRIAEALLDTASCALIALIAYYWEPDEKRKGVAAIVALALAAVCPFTAIYVATILTEIPTIFLALAICLLATFGFNASSFKRSLWWWSATGLVAGIAVFFRPDSGLFAGAVGLTLVITTLFRRQTAVASGGLSQTLQKKVFRVLAQGAVLSLAFALVLVPWTVRNWRVFHLFQPLAPTHGEAPGEYVPLGYYTWLQTWVDDQRYILPLRWAVGDEQIDIDDIPDKAFDSPDEKARVRVLLDQYNNPPEVTVPAENEKSQSPNAIQSSPTRAQSELTAKQSAATPSPDQQHKNNSGANKQQNSSNETADQKDNSRADDENQSDEQSENDQQSDENPPVLMTPEIDAGFAQLARERIARAPLRYYFWVRLKRAGAQWFDTHSEYYPFEGELFPLSDLDRTTHQHIWLPLFATLVWIYTLLGLAGGWCLWRSRSFAARRVLLLLALLIFIRLAFFSTMENPEPRYTVEIFPFLSVLGGMAIARMNVWFST
jgi:4-amino-4-deoxy-L-arabinose transferase-like glycosyltransferase